MTADSTWLTSMSEVYDRCLGPAVFAPPAADLAERARQERPDARRVLELAAGTGILTAGLVEAFPDAEVTATDLNPAMVEYAAARVPGASWRVADAMDLDFPDETFDLVACAFGVMFFPDRVGAYRGVRRLLTPGGSFWFTTWDTLETHTFEAEIIDLLRDVLPEDPPDFFARVPHGYADPDRVRADLQAAGLRVGNLVRRSLVGRSPSAATLAEGYCLGTPLRFQLQDRGDLAELVRKVSEELTRRLGSGPVEGDLGYYVVDASKPG
jgi:SAM-dependent methyltransferase